MLRLSVVRKALCGNSVRQMGVALGLLCLLVAVFVANRTNDKKIMSSTEEELLKNAKSIHEFSAVDIDGNNVQLSQYKGKVVLVVNVASK